MSTKVELPIRVAILGAGYGARILLPALLANKDFEVRGIWGRNTTRLGEVAREHPSVLILNDWTEASDPAIDAVALAVPPAFQAEAAGVFCKQDKALLFEKPLASNWQETLLMASGAGKNHRLLVDFGFRYLDPFKRIKVLLDSQELGPVESVKVEWLLSTRKKPDLTWNWKSDPLMGGGTLNLMGSHVLDYISWWFGEMQSVKCQKKTIVGKRPLEGSSEWKTVLADDYCQLDLLAKNPEVPIHICVSTAEEVPGPHQIHIVCRNGWLELGNPDGSKYFSGFILSGEKEGKPIFAGNNTSDLLAAPAEEDSRLKMARRLVDNWSRQIQGEPFEGVTFQDALYSQYLLEWAIQGRKPQPFNE